MQSSFMMPNFEEKEQFFEISVVSRLTGVSPANIRVWEKRHGVVAPKRSESRRRLYTAEDIQGLTLLKALVDRGHAIGTIASLSSAQLEERLGVRERADAGSGSVRKRSASCRFSPLVRFSISSLPSETLFLEPR